MFEAMLDTGVYVVGAVWVGVIISIILMVIVGERDLREIK